MSTELVELRSFYADPSFLLVARQDGEPTGCVGIRHLDATTAQIRRLFVRPAHRSAGLGRRLLEDATATARGRGAQQLVRTTLTSMSAAKSMYDAEGYSPIPYAEEPLDGLLFLGRHLDSQPPPPGLLLTEPLSAPAGTLPTMDKVAAPVVERDAMPQAR